MTVAGQVDLRSATDDQLRTLVDTIRAALPNELTEPLKVLAEVSRRLTELQHRREAEAGTCKSCNGTGGEYNLCSDCGGSGIEFVYGGHGNVLEVPCSTCAASPSSPASGVRVKAMEWVQNWPSDPLTGFAKVDHINRTYTVDHDGPRFYASTNVSPSDYSGDAIGNYGTFDEAKAACQADYEARIRSALGEHP